jgi:hypothetical protein
MDMMYRRIGIYLSSVLICLVVLDGAEIKLTGSKQHVIATKNREVVLEVAQEFLRRKSRQCICG